jgi:hypothetical protein
MNFARKALPIPGVTGSEFMALAFPCAKIEIVNVISIIYIAVHNVVHLAL